MTRYLGVLAAGCVMLAVGSRASALSCEPVFSFSMASPGPAFGDPLNEPFLGVSAFYTSNVFTPNVGVPGPRPLIVTGAFDTIGGVSGTSMVATWNGTAFEPLGFGIDGGANLLPPVCMHDFEGKLYFGGAFRGALGGPVSRGVIRWNPATSAYEAVNTLLETDTENVDIRAMAVFQGKLYVAGVVQKLGSLATRGVARYDSSTDNWEAVDGGIVSTTAAVSDMVVFNDGMGEKLYICGSYSGVGSLGSSGNWVARFNGTSWETVGGGIPSGVTRNPQEMLAFDDGTGPALYLACRGANTTNPATVSSPLLKWNGKNWIGVPGFFDSVGVTGASVSALGLYNDGTGTTLYGVTRLLGATPRTVMFKLENGRAVEVPNTAMAPAIPISDMLAHDDGNGARLWFGGGLTSFNGNAVNHLGQITGCTQVCPPDPCPADFNNDDDVQVNDIFSFLNAWFSAFGSGCP